MISDVYNLNITVTPIETSIACDRSISTIHITGIIIPSLKQQIEEMKEFSEILYK
jgi:hypothetical protein